MYRCHREIQLFLVGRSATQRGKPCPPNDNDGTFGDLQAPRYPELYGSFLLDADRKLRAQYQRWKSFHNIATEAAINSNIKADVNFLGKCIEEEKLVIDT